ncbi:hypothetical protein ZIOFF_007085 [Zingiber officinale]|uniref:Transducin/WD40 repeat-like superfamily protein n=1 Tax=Zingiber officinale TaxID=94328 RepID=A0A8J5LSR9_ZINOF|nr:hypothetical protein ZIOFF_007085 [Zingiber officinale]
MLRLRAFRQTNGKIVKIQLHPTHPWLVTADESDHVSVWNWEHRQVIYELKAGGVDERRLVGTKLEKLAEGETELKGKPTEAIRGGSITVNYMVFSVKQVGFYDDDVRYWQHWRNRSAAVEAPTAASQNSSAFNSPVPSTRGRHFLVICCENKAIFLDLVTMRGRDVPKQELDNRSLLCMEFLSRSATGDGPLIAFGGSDGVIRVLSMITWKLVRRYTGGHKGSITCLMTFMTSNGEAFLVSGASDGLLILWSADHIHDSRELVPKLSLKELRRIKPVPKLACHSVASWCHPRAPNLDILTCVKDSHIWAIEHPTYSALTRPLCELSSLVPPQVIASTKKLRVYCMVAHPLQPHLVATGTNIGVILSEFDARALPAAAALPTPPGSREHSAVYIVERELKLLNFQLSNTSNPSLGSTGTITETGRTRMDLEQLHVKQTKKHISTPAPHDSYSMLLVSSSGRYVAIVWPDIPSFYVYKASDWSVVDSGTGKLFAWDTCGDRYAVVETALTPRIPLIKGGSSKKAKEAAAAQAAAAAAAASAASSATVQVRILLDDGTSHVMTRSIEGRSDPVCFMFPLFSFHVVQVFKLIGKIVLVPSFYLINIALKVIGLHGGALLGVAYRTSRRISPMAATAISTQSMPLSGFGNSGVTSSFAAPDDPFSSNKPAAEVAPQNFQLYSWETYQPVSGLLAQPEWTAWDQTVEYCAFAYHQYIVISSLRPQFRYLGDVAIPFATGAVWHRRQLFVATPTTIECVFVDAGVAPIDLETKRKKEEMKAQEAQSRAFAEHGELALITVDSPQVATNERIPLRPPMLQVVRLASFQHAPSIPPFLTLPKQQTKVDGDDTMLKEMEERKVNEVAVAGGGVSVAVTRFPQEQKRPIGPLIVVGVRDGVLWLVDRYMCAHALSLSHPGIRCRCLAAYGDAVSAVKWATRLSREHHDDLAQFMLGMGYATEALHLPGISKRLEFDLAMQSNDLKRALQCLLTMSNSRDVGQEKNAADITEILSLTAVKQENLVDAVQGIAKFAKEFLDLIDAADATGQSDIAREALKRLAAAGSVKGALQGQILRGLALRLANHGELTRLSGLVNNLIVAGHGREAAFSAAVLGDNALMEKAWQDTGMLAEAVLHAHAHGRPTLKNLVQAWNKMLQKELDHTPSVKTDAAAAFLASLEDPKFTSLSDAVKKPPIEILPPGMASLSAPPLTINKKASAFASTPQLPSTTAPSPTPAAVQSESAAGPQTTPTSEADKPLMLEAPPPVDQSGATTADAAIATPTVTATATATATAPVTEPASNSAAEPVSNPDASPKATESPPPTEGVPPLPST